jgi:glycosyltransferase involved in cell wall biosynthesis
MALGRPVVATKVGAVAETVGGGGIVVPPEDPEALAAAMLVLLTDAGTATRLGKDGRERVASLFGLDAVAVRLDAVYEEVAHARHGPSAARLRSASSGRAREGRTRWPVSAGDRAHD